MTPRLAIVGGGGFGTALARAAAGSGTSVRVWSRRERTGERDGVEVTDDLASVSDANLIVLAVPSPHASELLQRLGRHLDGRHLMVHVSRGLIAGERERLQTLSQLITALTPVRRVGALAGPLVPDELLSGQPCGGVVGTHFPELVEALRQALIGPESRLRLYGSNDLLGVELASALTGALLFTLGFAKALGLTASVSGMLATRGLAEITRLGVAMGARASTFSGLAGVGDLVAAVAGARRPEIALGEMAATGADIKKSLRALGAHVESADVAALVTAHAERLGIQTPIASTVADILSGDLTGPGAVERLMSRPVGNE